ncbi:MAG: hypothetical protein KC463_07390 [Streptococcus sp.]|nr:hypothetical protein [Streptococcus sp.]
MSKSRTTLYRHMDSGVLSYETDATKNRTIDVSELQRVYGSIKGFGADVTESNSTKENNSEQSATSEIELLKAKLELLQSQLEIERQEKQQLLRIVESQAESMKQLSPAKDQKRNWLQRLFSR